MEFIFPIIGVLICCYLTYQYFKNKFDKNMNSSIPFANIGYFPIMGHALSLARDRKNFFLKCKERYGSIFRVNIFFKNFIVLLDPRDWSMIFRNSHLDTAFDETSPQIFGISAELFSKMSFPCMKKQHNQS